MYYTYRINTIFSRLIIEELMTILSFYDRNKNISSKNYGPRDSKELEMLVHVGKSKTKVKQSIRKLYQRVVRNK